MDVTDDKGNPTGERTTTNTYSKATKYKLGSALPSATGGLTNTVSWKGVDFSFMFTYGFGGKIYDVYEEKLLNDGNKTGYQLIVGHRKTQMLPIQNLFQIIPILLMEDQVVIYIMQISLS